MSTGYADDQAISDQLRAPTVDNSSMDDVVNSAGPELAAINWVFEHVTGESLTEKIITPITGNWAKIHADGDAWRSVGNSMTTVAHNLDANCSKVMDHWSGSAASSHENYIAIGWTAGLFAEREVSNAIGAGFDKVADGSEALGRQAANLLETLIRKLEEAAAEVWVPLAGWVAAAEKVWDAYQIYQKVLDIIETVKKLIEDVKSLFESISKITSALSKIKDVHNLADAAGVVNDTGQAVGEAKQNVKDIKDDLGQIKDDASDIKDHASNLAAPSETSSHGQTEEPPTPNGDGQSGATTSSAATTTSTTHEAPTTHGDSGTTHDDGSTSTSSAPATAHTAPSTHSDEGSTSTSSATTAPAASTHHDTAPPTTHEDSTGTSSAPATSTPVSLSKPSTSSAPATTTDRSAPSTTGTTGATGTSTGSGTPPPSTPSHGLTPDERQPQYDNAAMRASGTSTDDQLKHILPDDTARQNYQDLATQPSHNLSPDEAQHVADVRNQIHADQGEVMTKALNNQGVNNYLNGTYAPDSVAGSVAKGPDVAPINTPAGLNHGLALDDHGAGWSPAPAGATSAYQMRWSGQADAPGMPVPYGGETGSAHDAAANTMANAGGTGTPVRMDSPFTGTGTTGGGVPEWAPTRSAPASMGDRAEMWRVDADGSEHLHAVYTSRLGHWEAL